jgi:hypothetical protein
VARLLFLKKLVKTPPLASLILPLLGFGLEVQPVVTYHHLYLGQTYVYPLPKQPLEVVYHPLPGLKVSWHEESQSLRFTTLKPGIYSVQVLFEPSTWIQLTVAIYESEFQGLSQGLEDLSIRGNNLSTSFQPSQPKPVKLQGTIHSALDWAKYCALVAAFKDRVESEVVLDPLSSAWIQKKLIREIQKRYGPNLSLDFQPHHLYVSGEVGSESEKSLVLNYLSSFHPRIEASGLMSQATFEDQLNIILEFIEIKTGGGHSVGINWNDQQLSWQLGNPVLKFQSMLQFLITQGKAKVLSRPNLVAQNHKPARLHIGGEVPYEIKTSHRLNVEWKSYGIILEITPHHLTSGKIHLVFQISVSFPMVSPNTSSSLPAFSIRSVTSEVIVDKNETALLSGLIQQLDDLSSGGLPGLSAIPIFGHLFKSTKQSREHTELVVAITPKAYLYEPATVHRRGHLARQDVHLEP